MIPAPHHASKPVSISTWLRHDVRRHVHGDPRRAGGRDVAAYDPARAEHRAGSNELDPDRLSDRGNHRHPAHGSVDANADHAVAVVSAVSFFTVASIACAASGSF